MIEMLMGQGQRYGEPEYTAANGETQRAGAALRQHLNPEGQALLEQLEYAYARQEQIVVYGAFQEGFRRAVLLFLEVLMDCSAPEGR